MKKHFRLVLSLIIPVLVLILAACGNPTEPGGGGTTTTPPHTESTPPASATGAAEVKTVSVTIEGKSVTALTNAEGWTLYYFTPDTAKESKCTGACATAWPPLTSKGTPTTTAALPGKLDVQHNVHGEQVTYNGHPLYTYAADGGPGQTKGQGVNGKWFVATTDLEQIATNYGS